MFSRGSCKKKESQTGISCVHETRNKSIKERMKKGKSGQREKVESSCEFVCMSVVMAGRLVEEVTGENSNPETRYETRWNFNAFVSSSSSILRPRAFDDRSAGPRMSLENPANLYADRIHQFQ